MKRGLLILAGVLMALLAVEVVLRVTGIGMVRPQLDFDMNTRMAIEAGLFNADRRLLWRESDGPTGDDARSFRLVRVGESVPPKGRKFRILVLGDSCTRLSLSGRPYSALLEERLGPHRVEVFNASVPGYTSYQGLVWLRSELLSCAPDLVLVYYGWNDHWRTTGWTDRELAARFATWHLRLLNLFQRRHEPPPLRVPLPEFRENLLDIAALVASQGGRTIFLTAPAFFSAEANARHLQNRYVLPGDNVAAIHGSYQQEVRRLSEVTRARVCDIAQIFERVQEYESLLYPDGIHPTDLGHMVLASILADDIAVNELGAPDPHSDPAAVALAIIAQGLVASQQWGAALEKYRHAVRTAPQDLNLLLGYAWLLATCPTDSLRDPTSALNHLADYAGPTQAGYQFHDVKAAALAALGRYAEAVESAQAALSDLEALGGGESDLASGIRERLSLYEADQPYRLSLPQQQ